MKPTRALSLMVLVGLLALAFALDRPERTQWPHRAAGSEAGVLHAAGSVWFCPGGSAPGGPAEVALHLVSVSSQTRTATVTATPDPSVLSSGDSVAGLDDRPGVVVEVPAGGRMSVSPAEQAPGARWVGAVVEVNGDGVIVEQVVADQRGGLGRSVCLTRTSSRWIVPHGATRADAEGERFHVLLQNPYPDAAVADIAMSADVSRDSIEGLVVPAASTVAVDVTAELTVASSVMVDINVLSGQVAVSAIQIMNGPVAGRGTFMAPALPSLSPIWHVPVGGFGPGRRDVIAVANPSQDLTAEVDLEIIADNPSQEINPIELTVLPGRSATADLSTHPRLADVGTFSVVARSLDGVPVAVSSFSVTDPDARTADDFEALAALGSDPTGEGLAASLAPELLQAVESGAQQVVGAGGSAGASVAARRWMLAEEVTLSAQNAASSAADPVTDTGEEASDGAGAAWGVDYTDDVSQLVIVNPSTVGIAVVDLVVGGTVKRSLEIGPTRRARVPLAWLGEQGSRFVVQVHSTAPVVAATELVGLTSRAASLGVIASPPIPIQDLDQ